MSVFIPPESAEARYSILARRWSAAASEANVPLLAQLPPWNGRGGRRRPGAFPCVSPAWNSPTHTAFMEWLQPFSGAAHAQPQGPERMAMLQRSAQGVLQQPPEKNVSCSRRSIWCSGALPLAPGRCWAGILIAHAPSGRPITSPDCTKHCSSAAAGLGLALLLARLPLDRLKTLLLPIMASPWSPEIAGGAGGHLRLGASRWISIGGSMCNLRIRANSRQSCCGRGDSAGFRIERPIDLLRPPGVS